MLAEELELLPEDLEGEELRLPPDDDREGAEARGALLDDDDDGLDEEEGLEDDPDLDP